MSEAKMTNHQEKTMTLFRYYDEVGAGTGDMDFFASPQTLRSLEKRGLLSAEHRQDSLGWWNWHYTLTDTGRAWLAAQGAKSDE